MAVSDVLIGGRDDNRLYNKVLSMYGVPAYARRARAVEDAYEDLIHRCRRQREEWLAEVRDRLGRLLATGYRVRPGDWLEDLAAAVGVPELRPAPTLSRWRLRRSLRGLAEMVGRFNANWRSFVNGLDLDAVNQLRDGYNRFYLLEKECALRSATLAKVGFQPLPPLMRDELFALYPILPEPTVG